MIFPERAHLWHGDANIIPAFPGAGFRLVSPWEEWSVRSLFAYVAYIHPGVDGDVFTQSFIIKSGTYTFTVAGWLDPNKGMLDWSIDDAAPFLAGQDWYSATPMQHAFKTCQVTIDVSGRHVLKGTVNGKNPLSGGYEVLLVYYAFRPLVDTEHHA